MNNFHKLFVLLLCTWVTGYRNVCNEMKVLQQLRITTFDFSVRLLDRVAQETDGHFVFAPISPWLQLLALADGAQGKTLDEILNVTRLNTICSRHIIRKIFNSFDKESSETMQRRSIFIIDKLLSVKKSFVSEVEELNAVEVLQATFNAKTANLDKISDDINTTAIITDLLVDDDFKSTTLLIAEIANMKANWISPFNPANTQREAFYSSDERRRSYVNMMQQVGNFNFKEIPEIHAQAIELPFSDRTKMILLLPTKGNAENLFKTIQNTRIDKVLRSLNINEERLINLKVPRFNITTVLDNVPEHLFDMGLRRMFTPRLAEFKKISDYILYVSIMSNKYGIEVTETGVTASITPENLVMEKDSINVTFNRPFVFLIMDKVTNVLLFGGICSKPHTF